VASGRAAEERAHRARAHAFALSAQTGKRTATEESDFMVLAVGANDRESREIGGVRAPDHPFFANFPGSASNFFLQPAQQK